MVFLATYLPLRTNPIDAIRFMWDEQRTLSRIGFPLEVAGHVYQHPPWWSAAWFAWEAGPLVLVATLVLAVLGFLRIERRVAWALAVGDRAADARGDARTAASSSTTATPGRRR